MEKRIRLVFIVVLFVFTIIIVKLFYWQILMASEFGRTAVNQRTKTFDIPGKRGEIMSSDGTSIVSNEKAYLLYAEPKKIDDPIKLRDKLAELLEVDVASISANLGDKEKSWVPVTRKLPEDKKKRIESQRLAGIGFEEESIRFYPESSMAAHVLGFVGLDAKGDEKGYFGLEGHYDRQLRGREGTLRQETDALGLPILMGLQNRINPVNGRGLVLHIDKSIQFIIEEKLKLAIERYQAKGGWVIVMDPNTGGILGMASYPNYDPKLYGEFEGFLYKNPVVAETYEPGSTFKALILAAAINENKVEPNDVFEEDGPIEVGGYRIRTWNNEYAGKLNATQILERSSNVGMVQIGDKLGKDLLYKYIDQFGFGKTTNIDLEDESSPSLRSKGTWYDIDFATATFGQGIAVTPIQMVTAVSALANGGNLMKPQIVKSIIEENGARLEIKPKVVRKVISPSTSAIISEMLVQSAEHGEAHFALPKGYRVAGKTGTAQIPIAGHYDPSKTIASFVGYAPIPNPKFVMLTTLKEPGTSPWGSETAAPLFFEIARDLFNYYGIPPTE